MNKNVLALFFAFFALLGDNIGQNKRRVLIEEFTNASCPPCAAQNPDFNELLKANYAKVTPIKYQTSFPGVDPMNEANPVDVKTREDYYEISGVPYGLYNGKIIPEIEFYEGAPGDLQLSQINSEYNRNTPIKLVINHSLVKLDSVNITISVSNNSTTNFVSKNLRLHTAIVEKNILFPSPAGTNGEIEFSFVMRKMFPSAEGTILGIDTIKAGQVLTFTFKEKMIENVYSFRNMAVVAFLQNYDTKEVFQSELSEPKAIDPAVDFDLTVNDISGIPNNVDGGYCISEYIPKVEVVNNGKQNVNGFFISFLRDEDINTLVTKQYSDVILPGQKIEVEFDKQSSITYSNNSYLFSVLNSGSEK
ncbi:MAG: Omp28-related outer membrane protein, partial [Saprospiraceae bacterium]